jgi:hypothetical protein
LGQSERGHVAKAAGELELILAEGRLVTEAVDVERPEDATLIEQWDADERLGLVRRRAGDRLDARARTDPWKLLTPDQRMRGGGATSTVA